MQGDENAEMRKLVTRHGGAASEPEPVVIRCARCAFVAEGDLEQAREAFCTHECDPAACRTCNSSRGDRSF